MAGICLVIKTKAEKYHRDDFDNRICVQHIDLFLVRNEDSLSLSERLAKNIKIRPLFESYFGSIGE